MNYRLFVPKLVLLPLFSLFFLSCNAVTGGVTNLLISDAEEVALGNKFKAEILASPDSFPVLNNAVINQYIDSIGQVIANAQNDRKTISYTFTVINRNIINAFAIPGGHVFIYAGLIKACRNEAELAGVIAHEIGHITKRHGMRRMVQAYGVQFLLDILLGEESNLTTVMADLTTSLILLEYGRANEFEADGLAVNYSILAGYNPRGTETFLSLLGEKSSDSNLLKYFSTHPPMSERVEKVKALVDKNGQNLSEELLYKSNFEGYLTRF